MPAGRPPFVPTAEQRKLVEALAGYGIPRDQICQLVTDKNGKGICEDTLRKVFPAELGAGTAKANAKVAGALFKNAVENMNVAAQIFWAKTRMGWKETSVQEHSVAEDGSFKIEFVRASSNGNPDTGAV